MATKQKRSTIKSRKEEIRARRKRNRFNPLQAELDKPLAKSLKEGLAVGATLAGPGKFLKVGKVFKRGDTAKKAGKRTAETRAAAKAKGKAIDDKRFKAIQAEGKARKRTGSQPRGTFGPDKRVTAKRLEEKGVRQPNFRKAGTDKRARENLQKRGEERLAKRPAVVERSAKSIKKNPLTATIRDAGTGKIIKVGPKGLTKAQRQTIKREAKGLTAKEKRDLAIVNKQIVKVRRLSGRKGGGSTFK
jgi:hypothetical protein